MLHFTCDDSWTSGGRPAVCDQAITEYHCRPAQIVDHAQYRFYGEPVLAQARPLHACAFLCEYYRCTRLCTLGYWNQSYHATLAMWGVLHGFAGCQASSAMGGSRHSAFVPFSRPPPRSKGASVNCKGLQWCTVGSVPLDSPLVWGACFALRTSGVRDA